MRHTAGFTFLLTFLAWVPAQAQYFGQNRVNYRTFDFNLIHTEHFDVYYYDGVRDVALDAARMAERSYARLSRLLNHQYRERQPIILYASHADFQQNNLTDISEGVQGVTDALRHRVMLPFTGSYEDFEHVLQHEIVHQFQFDIFARGHVGAGLERLIAVQPPLWLMEGMAEYLSVGSSHTSTDMWIRDAAVEGHLPTIDQLTHDGRIFPYRFGHALMAYIGERWGDDAIAEIFHGVASGGVETGMRRALGMSLSDLSQAWHNAVRAQHLPDTAITHPASAIAQTTVSRERSTGRLHVSPALSPDGTEVAYFSEAGSFSVDLYLADVQTGAVKRRLVKGAFSANFESLRFLNSVGAWSPDGKLFAFPAQHGGRDDLVVFDVQRRKVDRRIKVPIAGLTNPTWSPDGRQLVFTGLDGGVSDLFLVNFDGTNLHRLTNDRHADLHPAWSPDGKTIAFVTDRSATANFDELTPGPLSVALLNLSTGDIDILPWSQGSNTNPQWSPDGKSLAFLSDRTGVNNLFLYESADQTVYQLTNVFTGISGITPTSPAISWAREADRLAFTYYENGEYNVYTIDHPIALKGLPYPVQPRTVVAGPQRSTTGPSDANNPRRMGRSFGSIPRSGMRSQPLQGVSVKELLDNVAMALPDTNDFEHSRYSPTLRIDYFTQPQFGYVRDNFGGGVFGGAAVALSDMMGNRRLLLGGQVNGRLAESQVTAIYANMARRTNWAVGVQQTPYFYFAGASLTMDAAGQRVLNQRLQRFIVREAFAEAYRPFSRFSRIEYRLRAVNMDIGEVNLQSIFDPTGGFIIDQNVERTNFGGASYLQPSVAWVFDNSIPYVVGPLRGRRNRLEYAPGIGTWKFHQVLLDTRRYDPVVGAFTLATRFMFFGRFGRDSRSFPVFLGVPDLLRGYTAGSFRRSECSSNTGEGLCKELNQLIGSRVAVFNAELRLPLVEPLSFLPTGFPPLEGAVFFDAGIAWSDGSQLTLSRSQNADKARVRQPLTSWGVSLRSNIVGFFVARADFTKPLSRGGHNPYWTLSLGPTF